MNLKEARKNAGLTQEQAAAALGVSSSAVCQWETGMTRPSRNKWMKISEVYDLTPNQLFSAVVATQMEAFLDARQGQTETQGE